MSETVTAAQMKAVEQAAMQSGRVSGRALMERAGAGVVRAISDRWPDLQGTAARVPAAGAPLNAESTPIDAIVLCGPGNNGGDGYVIARLLAEKGWRVFVSNFGDISALPPDAKANYDLWARHAPVVPMTSKALCDAVDDAAERVVIVDALFGIGQRAPMDEPLAPFNAMMQYISNQVSGRAPSFVAVDLPTGYDADTGDALADQPAPADLIVTFHARKPCHDSPNLADATLTIVDIGL